MQQPRKTWMRVLAAGWVAAIYLATFAMHLLGPDRDPGLAVQARNAGIHALGYGLLGMLVMWAAQPASLEQCGMSALVAAFALLIGIGQETLQAILRMRVELVNSTFDLVVDTTAAALAAWFVLSWLKRHPPPNGLF